MKHLRIVVATCWKYRDCQGPFFRLFYKFWPDCPYNVTMLTDFIHDSDQPENIPESVGEVAFGLGWCANLAAYLETFTDANVLLLQDDMFFNAPVDQTLMNRALEQLHERDAAMVRLYPCPGADEDYGDQHFGRISKNARYRVSCQASIWNPEALHSIASQFNTPQEFELEGSKLSNCMDQEFLALKRDCPQPWPISYECTAIVRGKWQRSALDLCAQHGIPVDTSMREVA